MRGIRRRRVALLRGRLVRLFIRLFIRLLLFVVVARGRRRLPSRHPSLRLCRPPLPQRVRRRADRPGVLQSLRHRLHERGEPLARRLHRRQPRPDGRRVFNDPRVRVGEERHQEPGLVPGHERRRLHLGRDGRGVAHDGLVVPRVERPEPSFRARVERRHLGRLRHGVESLELPQVVHVLDALRDEGARVRIAVTHVVVRRAHLARQRDAPVQVSRDGEEDVRFQTGDGEHERLDGVRRVSVAH